MRLSVIARQRVKRSVPALLRLACMVALLGLGVFAVSMLYPRPLVIIFSMSIGHMIGMLAVALYLLAILVDMVRSSPVIAPENLPVDDMDSEAGADDRAAHPGDDAPPPAKR